MVVFEEDREQTYRDVDEQGAFPQNDENTEDSEESDQDLGDHRVALGVPKPLQNLSCPGGSAGLGRPEEAPDVLLRVIPVVNNILNPKSLF